MKLFSAVNMDIVSSRTVDDRHQLQNKLSNYIDQINRDHSSILVAPITITLGDEWQLVTNKPSESYNLVHEFQKLLWNEKVELYAGIGIGELSTPIYDDVRKMDGPCFHAARNAIGIVKNVDKYKDKCKINKLNNVFLLIHPSINNGHNTLDLYSTLRAGLSKPAMQESEKILECTVNSIIENNEILKAKMTSKQKEIYINYSNLGSYRKVLGVCCGTTKETLGGISQKLNNASYFTIQRNHQMVNLLLETYCK